MAVGSPLDSEDLYQPLTYLQEPWRTRPEWAKQEGILCYPQVGV